MHIKNWIKKTLEKTFNVYLYQRKNLPFGNDIIHDLNRKKFSNIRVIVDVWCHSGKTIKFFHHHFASTGIYGFEAVKETYESCAKNIKGIPDLVLENLGVSNKAGRQEISLFPSELSPLISLLIKNQHPDPQTKKLIINTNKLQDYLEENKMPQDDMLKIDAEGSELDILQGCIKNQENRRLRSILWKVGFNEVWPKFITLYQAHNFLKDYNFALAGFYDLMIHDGRLVCSNALFSHNDM